MAYSSSTTSTLARAFMNADGTSHSRYGLPSSIHSNAARIGLVCGDRDLEQHITVGVAEVVAVERHIGEPHTAKRAVGSLCGAAS
jgi:hypothetical protein